MQNKYVNKNKELLFEILDLKYDRFKLDQIYKGRDEIENTHRLESQSGFVMKLV